MAAAVHRVALVTGASSGIGKATALAFARANYETVLADTDENQGHNTAQQCERIGGKSLFVECDVSDESSVRHLFDTIVSTFGRLDAAFNNAGIEGLQAPTGECTIANFDRVIAVNLRGLWLCMRE